MSNWEYVEKAKAVMNKLIDIENRVSIEKGLDLSRQHFEMEFLAASFYVAGADNNISAIEVELVNYMFDQNLSPQTLGPFVSGLSQQYNALMVDLKLPGWGICKSIDDMHGNSDATGLYISTMEIILPLFGAADGNLDAREERFIKDFVNRLERDRYR